jgi:hypothetical protein
MSSINDIISSTAATNPTVGSALSAGTMQAELLSTLNGSSSDNSLFSLIAAANSEAALAPAALYTPSSELTAAMNASNSASTSPFETPAITDATTTAGMESQLLEGLGGSFNAIA